MESDSESLTDALRERVLAAALAVRPGGDPVPRPPLVRPLEAFRWGGDVVCRDLHALDAEDWRRPALRGLTVQQLVGHLLGVERDWQAALRGDADVGCADHVASTQPVALAQAEVDPASTLAAVEQALDASAAAAGELPASTAIRLHGVELPLDAFLVARTFELWTHDADVRQAVGMAPLTPPSGVLALMTRLAVPLLPGGMLAARAARTAWAARLVLTGPGGGTWTIGDGATTPGVRIVADAVGFCRLVANRLAPATLGAVVTGDDTLAEDLFAAAAALALD